MQDEEDVKRLFRWCYRNTEGRDNRMEEGAEILTEVYPKDNNPGRIGRLWKYVEKLYDIDLRCTDLDGGFIENLMEEEKKPDDDSEPIEDMSKTYLEHSMVIHNFQ